MYGWMGTILKIDLTKQEIVKEPLKLDFAKKWLGGEGFGAKLLWDEVGAEVEDGLDPRNVLIYTSSPLTSTLAPGCGRLEIVTKSPITGIFGDSNSGGHFAPEFKQAGYDIIVIRGRAEKPVYLWIDDDQVEIRDAGHLWGKTVPETDKLIKEELGDKNIQVSCIGPAGENQVRFAILINNLSRAPGLNGCGAVAGSKNLKAVAVRGTKGVRIARPEEFEQACWEAREKVKSMPLSRVLRDMGTMYLFRIVDQLGLSPVKNFNVTPCPYLEQVCGEKWAKEYVVNAIGCYGCNVHCSHYAMIKEGPYAGLGGEGYEFGGMGVFLYWYGSSNLAFGIAAVKYCNDNGLDSNEPGMLLAWATDCFKRGILSEKDTDDLILDWGDENVALELLRKITYREGFGGLLAEGLARAARNLGRGSEKYAYTVKDKTSYEPQPRGSYGFALASATSTRGADHLKGWPIFEFAGPSPEVLEKYFGHPKTGDRRSPEGKARSTVYNQSTRTLMDILGTCKFHTRAPFSGLTVEDYARMTSAATGIDLTGEDLLRIADRVWNLEQAYNVRLGLSRKDDTMPEMYFEEPFSQGPMKGFILKKESFDKALDDYYQHRGWDIKTGIPARETLEELGLKDVADELGKRGVLPEITEKRK